MNQGRLMLLLFIFNGFLVNAQTEQIKVTFNNSFGDSEINLTDSSFSTHNADNLQISTVKYYISSIRLMMDSVVVSDSNNNFHLIDASLMNEEINYSIQKNLKYNCIQFNLGIDSITNVAGVKGGCLDPTKGMYWTWQSGYINFKLEGSSNQCAAFHNGFQFHIGGYQTPNYVMQTISLPIMQGESVHINLDLQKVLSQIDLKKQNQIMSPSTGAVAIAQIVAKTFAIKTN